jgi:hypothetical protein
VNQNYTFKLKQTHVLESGFKITFQSSSIESIEASPKNPEAYPAGSGVNFVFKVERGLEHETLVFSELSAGYTSKTHFAWQGYEFDLGRFQNEAGTDIQVTLKISKSQKLGAAANANPRSPPWSITFDDFSAFHLDGKYLNLQSDGHYFLHVLTRASTGPEERIYVGTLTSKTLSMASTLEVSKIKSPPERTLLPDEVVAHLALTSLVNGKPSTAVAHFQMGSSLDPLNAETTKLLQTVKTTIEEIKNSKPVVTHSKIQNPKPRLKISKEQALKTAIGKGFFATWTQVELRGLYWVVSGRSKSAMPAMFTVVSAYDGSIVAFSKNWDPTKIQSSFFLTQPSESYDVQNIETAPAWTKISI